MIAWKKVKGECLQEPPWPCGQGRAHLQAERLAKKLG